jgi:hypothetical protein
MKITHKNILGSLAVATSILSVAFALPVSAQTNRASTTQERMMIRQERQASTTAARIQKGDERGGAMIDQRISSLNKLLNRIQSMKHISSADMNSLSASIQAEISGLSDLKANISNDVSTTSMRNDLSSITKSFRIYALIEPQARIVAASDRVLGIISSLETIGNKVNMRIASSTQASTTIYQSLMSDFSLKLASASSSAQSAINTVASLKPDNGDTTIAASNKTALEAARSSIVSAHNDLKDAEKDIRTVIGMIIK